MTHALFSFLGIEVKLGFVMDNIDIYCNPSWFQSDPNLDHDLDPILCARISRMFTVRSDSSLF